jgi:1-deoxy-D-xylulose-5-phosphate reductoisomerase
MRTPIAYGLAYPERIDAGVEPLDLCRIGTLDFERPDFIRFPCLRLAYEALERGGNAPAVLNAANEVAVEAFLDGRLAFTRIPEVIEQTLSSVPWEEVATLEDVLSADTAGREAARQHVAAPRKQA